MPRTNPTTTPCSVNGCEKAAAAPDWTEAEVAVLMAAKLTDHRKRYSGPDPDESLAAVAVKLGRSEVACRCKRRRVEHERGHRTGDQWTVEGLWTAEEDEIVRAHMAPEGERVDAWTWPAVGEAIGRTPHATRVRAHNLRCRDRNGGSR